MPQMMPLNWMMLFLLFIMIFMLFNMMNYFIYYKKEYLNKFNKKIKFFNLNWKW